MGGTTLQRQALVVWKPPWSCTLLVRDEQVHGQSAVTLLSLASTSGICSGIRWNMKNTNH